MPEEKTDVKDDIEEGDKAVSDDSEGDEDKGSETEPKEELDEEPPVRGQPPQSKEDKRLGYQFRKLQEENAILRQKIEAGDTGEGGDELTPEATRLIQQRAKELIDPLAAQIQKDATERELKDYLRDNPDDKKNESKLRKFLDHPAYAQVPVEVIASYLGRKEAEKRGAEKQKQADEEAEKTKTGGHSSRKKEGKVDIWGMSNEEFEKYDREVRKQMRDRE